MFWYTWSAYSHSHLLMWLQRFHSTTFLFLSAEANSCPLGCQAHVTISLLCAMWVGDGGEGGGGVTCRTWDVWCGCEDVVWVRGWEWHVWGMYGPNMRSVTEGSHSLGHTTQFCRRQTLLLLNEINSWVLSQFNPQPYVTSHTPMSFLLNT